MLEPNVGQLMLNASINRQRSAGFPVRILLLKPRQVGWSTWSEAEAFYYINMYENRTALCVSADNDSTNLVFNMTKLFQAELPANWRRHTDSSNRYEIVYSAPWRSKFITQTAGKDVLGRGGTVHFFHGSEVAFWPKAKEGLAAVLQMVPNDPDTTVILESTANGVGGAFYDMYQQAVDRLQKDPEDLSGYIPVFFPWYKFPEYNTQVPKGFKCDEDERLLKEEFSLSDCQVFWRRLKIQELGGDIALFKQEYPSTYLEAFQASGNPVFTQGIIDFQKKTIVKNPRRCIFTSEENREDVESIFNCWQIATPSQGGHQYSMGVDTMEGRLSDVQDPKSNLDCDAIVVYDRTSNEISAIYHGRGSQADLAYQVWWCAQYYNNAWIAPEIPNSMVILKFLRDQGYENIYNRQVHDERLVVEDSENMGWRTTLVTRKWLVDDFITVVRDSLRVQFSDIVDQMQTFIRNKDGKPIHMPGKHDDLLLAAMIAIQVHLRCPVELMYPHEQTGGDEERKRLNNLSMHGAIDYGPWEEEDDSWQEYTD